MPGTIHVLRGIPGSGKSTIARQWVAAGTKRVRVSRDDIRRAHFGVTGKAKFNAEREQLVTTIEHQLVKTYIDAGHDVIVDDTNLRAKFVAPYGKIAPVEYIDVPVDLDVAIMRDKLRPAEEQVGEKVIRSFWDRYIAPNGGLPEPPRPYKALVFEPVDQSGTFPESAYIVDVDGTLAHVDPDNPRSFYDELAAGSDLVDGHVRLIVNELADAGHQIIIMSGRKRRGLRVLQLWLQENHVKHDHLYMRADDDNRDDAEVKYDLFNQHVRGRFAVYGVIDDRPKVCRMWRQIGLKTFQVGDPHTEF